MAKGKKRRRGSPAQKAPKKKDAFDNNPFRAAKSDLQRALKQASAKSVAPTPAPPPPEPTEQSFSESVPGAVPLDADPRGQWKPELPSGRASHVEFYDEDQEAYEALLDLVEGRAHFDIADSDEFVEGCIEGLDRRILGRLRRGEFAFRLHLDLHGLMRDDAKNEVENFLIESRRGGERCVLIVHGRGLNSKDKIPVLKGLLRTWLARGRIARSVLAFATARPHDGGAGAMYVLLRR